MYFAIRSLNIQYVFKYLLPTCYDYFLDLTDAFIFVLFLKKSFYQVPGSVTI